MTYGFGIVDMKVYENMKKGDCWWWKAASGFFYLSKKVNPMSEIYVPEKTIVGFRIKSTKVQD